MDTEQNSRPQWEREKFGFYVSYDILIRKPRCLNLVLRENFLT